MNTQSESTALNCAPTVTRPQFTQWIHYTFKETHSSKRLLWASRSSVWYHMCI